MFVQYSIWKSPVRVLGLTELPNNLLCRKLFSSWHLVPSLGLHCLEILSLKVASFKGGRSQLEAGLVVDVSNVTWADFVDRFTAEHIDDQARATAIAYHTVLDHFDATISPARLRSVDSAVIARWVDTLRKSKRSPATVAKYIRTLKAALKWAVSMKLLAELPAFPASKRSDNQAKARAVTTEEFERMLAVVVDVVGEAREAHWQRSKPSGSQVSG